MPRGELLGQLLSQHNEQIERLLDIVRIGILRQASDGFDEIVDHALHGDRASVEKLKLLEQAFVGLDRNVRR